ncbi:unnamed protein product [Schistosoma margrebowiei]|uniref:Uncharacterized protein n=1 Tax=Schistosoma margrebowiei TaxID=48269 RepID=A0A183MXX9_9TREM|nr:unnamed protein product [Schistosoma margrebowiei]
MNIDALCKVYSKEYNSSISFSNNEVMFSNTDGTSCRFVEILDAETTNVQLFEKHLRPLVKAFLAGYNACIMCYGEIKSEIHMLLNGFRADSVSNLTKLLYDEIGGNCYTRVILCLSANPEPEMYSLLLRFTAQLTNITNSPVMNDECALLLAERARETQSILEQLKLREHIQELSQNLGKTHEELSHATDERMKLSKAWLLSEEDRIDANEKLAKTELELHEVTLKNKQLQLICEKATEAAKHSVELQRSNDVLNNYCTELKKKLGDLHEELNRMVR